MSNVHLDSLLKDSIQYSTVQETLWERIRDLDEEAVLRLEREGHALLEGMTSRLNVLKKANPDGESELRHLDQEIQSLIQWIEKSQAQNLRNQSALMDWREKIGTQLQLATSPVKPGKTHEIQDYKGVLSDKGAQIKPRDLGAKAGRPGISSWPSSSPQVTVGQKFDRLT